MHPALPCENGQQPTVDGFNSTSDTATLKLCVHQLFENAAEKYSDQTALVCGDTIITFDELNKFANRIATVLIRQGISNQDLVGVALDRSVDLVAVLLAVLKTGATYVPIDPAFPAERINQMMDDACPKLLITGYTTPEAFKSWKRVCLSVDEILSMMNQKTNSNNLNVVVGSEELAYVMYTSGSTGRPKGVEVTHGSVANLLLSMREEPGCGNTDRLLAITTVSFDMAVLELFLPLICGATAIIAERRDIKDMSALIKLMENYSITIMQGTPAMWQMLLDAGWEGQPRLEKILCGGEALPQSLAERLLACGDMIWNMYGPTEATVYGSLWRVIQGHDVIIGNPIANGRLYVLDENLAPLPIGSPGELYIGGAGVARGYRNNKKLTQSKFLDNPFHRGRMYQTGDLARFLTPGKLSVIGRIDGQVKIRGHRIELGDIEGAITSHQNISGAVVVCRDDRLVAYFIEKAAARGSKSEETKGALDHTLRPWLAGRLPDYMMPAFFVRVEAFPVTINGKIDREALPDPVAAICIPADMQPVTELERHIFAVWANVLGHDRIGVDDNFFEIGGDSARVIRVQTGLQKSLSRTVSVPKLFEHYTIKTLAGYLSSSPVAAVRRPIFKSSHVKNAEDIAIISMACRLPGDVDTPESFWDLLKCGGDAITNVPADRWDAEVLHDIDPDAKGKSYCRQGGFIRAIDSFDTSFFGISPREARSLDPSQYLMLETCWEGLERAGYTAEEMRGSQTGVFIGTSNVLSHNCFNLSAPRNLTELDGYTVTGSAGGTMSGRISYQLGLEGPSMTIDTACSSSLVTTHLACMALRLGECDMAVSGGISLMLNPGMHVEFSRLRGMSHDGRCRAFSADTEGTGWSEGSAVAILKRLCDAKRDGDQIHGVIRGTAVNHDGRSATLTTPSGPAQQRLIRTALSAARLHPDDIDYIEAHGTGTKLGDPIEATALGEVFGPSRADVQTLWIGAAKSNIGHTQAAAGLVGLLKVTLAMKHSVIPQTLHVTKPTPAVDWQGSNMRPVQNKQPWPSRKSRPRRAGISAFGIGGTNAHIIVEEPPPWGSTVADKVGMAVRPHPTVPFVLSANTDAALLQQAQKLRRHLYNDGSLSQDNLVDIAYSLATTRTHFRKRLAVTAEDKPGLLRILDSIAYPGAGGGSAGENPVIPEVAALFTGQGSQWPGMGKYLYGVYPVFREAVTEIVTLFTGLELPLLDVLLADPGTAAAAFLDRTDYAQPALFTLEVALWHLWKSWGVKPEFVLGHSLGELSAAHVAGVLDLADACRLVAVRGRLMQAQSSNGGMVSLGANATEVASAIGRLGYGDKVEVAAYNTPMQTVISGDMDAITGMRDHFVRQGRKAKTIMVGHAFHSHHMDSMLSDFRAIAETIQFHPPRLSMVSSLDGKLVKAGQIECADYWVKQVREAVRFSDGMQSLASQGVNIFLELGPQKVLCGMGAACLADDDRSKYAAWLPSLSPGENGALTLQHSIAELHMRHVSINWSAYFKPFDCRRVQLPTYAFQRQLIVRPHTCPLGFAHDSSKTTISTAGDAPARFQFEVVWQQAKLSNVPPGGTWGALLGNAEAAWVERVTASLSQAGIQLVEARNLKDAKHLDGLLCLWDSDVDTMQQTQDFVEMGVAQLQTAVKMQFTPALVWVTRNAVAAGTQSEDRAMRLGASPLWGLMRTARNEHPELDLRLVDLGEDIGPAISSAFILHDEPECAVRQNRVLVPRMQRVSLNPSVKQCKQRLIRTDGAVLITGGVGDLGSRVARWLVSEHEVNDLILTSRRGMATPGAEALVAELSRLGARVTVVASNVANPKSVQSIMEIFSKCRPLRGVVHAAGVSDSGVLSAMTPERCRKTLAPKVHGAWLLHCETLNMDLDVFMMFSSISGVMGMQGLANYAAANTFLDALAYLRRARGLPATSVAYGTWGGDGMASRLVGATRFNLTQFGLDLLEPEEAIELLRQAIVSTRALTVVAALDLGRLRIYHEERGRLPPLLSSLVNQHQHRPKVARGWYLDEALSEAEPAQHGTIMLKMVREVVAKSLGFSHPLDVEVDRPLQEIGIDSLSAVQMRNHLATLTGLALSVNIAYLHSNLRELSQSLLAQLYETNTSSTTTGASSVTSTATIFDPPRVDMKAVQKGCLDSTIRFDNVTQNPARLTMQPEAAFLTGATGFVGASVLNELLKRGVTTYCLVRVDGAEDAWNRVVTVLKGYNLWEPCFVSLIKPVVGDIAQPLLGLSEEVFDDLADRLDTICHSGGLVDWMRQLDDYIGPNIVSVHEVLRLASRGRAKSIHLVSTISTLPKHMGLDLAEGDYEYGYGTSKYIAEKLVAAARWRGARAVVYRLPYVTASTTTGHFRLDRGDFLHNLIDGCLQMGAFPSLDADLSRVQPVDYLSKTIVAVMTQDFHRLGRDYDFLNAHAPTCNDFFEMIGGVSGSREIVKFGTWRQRALDYATVHPRSPLARIAAVLDGYTDETAAGMFKGLPVGKHVFGGREYPAPLIDKQFVDTYLSRINKH